MVHFSFTTCLHAVLHSYCLRGVAVFLGGGGVLWRAELGPEEKKQLKSSYTPRAHCRGAGVDMQYCSNAGAHGTIREGASSCNGQFSPPKNVGKDVRGWQGLRHGKRAFSCLADVNFLSGDKGGFLVQKGQKGGFFSTKWGGGGLVQSGGVFWYKTGGFLVQKMGVFWYQRGVFF